MTGDGSGLLDEARTARENSDFRSLERIARQLIAHGETTADVAAAAIGYYHLGIALSNLNRGSEAATATRQSIALYTQLGDSFSAAKAMMNLGAIELDNNLNVAQARRLYESSIAIVRDLGKPVNLAIALGNLGEICRIEGDYTGAIRNAGEALELFRTLGDDTNEVWQLANLALFKLSQRQYGQAIEHLDEAHALLSRNPNPRWVAYYFDVWLLLAATLGRLDIAAMLMGFVDSFRDRHDQPRLEASLPWLSGPKERLARELPHERFDELLAAGEALDIDRAQALARTLRA